MAFSHSQSSGRSRGRRRSLGGSFSEINVTPFVDVMLVLLVIFMVTAPLLTVSVPVDLPKTKGAQMNNQTELLIVTVDASGKSYLQETPLEGDGLIERLIAVTGSNPDAKIYVRGDQAINYGRIMEVMGLIAAAGFNKVSLIAQLPSGPVKGNKLQNSSGRPLQNLPAQAHPTGIPSQMIPHVPNVTYPQVVTRSLRSGQQPQHPTMHPMSSAPLQMPTAQTPPPGMAPNSPLAVVRSQ